MLCALFRRTESVANTHWSTGVVQWSGVQCFLGAQGIHKAQLCSSYGPGSPGSDAKCTDRCQGPTWFRTSQEWVICVCTQVMLQQSPGYKCGRKRERALLWLKSRTWGTGHSHGECVLFPSSWPWRKPGPLGVPLPPLAWRAKHWSTTCLSHAGRQPAHCGLVHSALEPRMKWPTCWVHCQQQWDFCGRHNAAWIENQLGTWLGRVQKKLVLSVGQNTRQQRSLLAFNCRGLEALILNWEENKTFKKLEIDRSTALCCSNRNIRREKWSSKSVLSLLLLLSLPTPVNKPVDIHPVLRTDKGSATGLGDGKMQDGLPETTLPCICWVEVAGLGTLRAFSFLGLCDLWEVHMLPSRLLLPGTPSVFPFQPHFPLLMGLF